MNIDKKYLIANGCSYTAGHTMWEKASWATYLAEDLGLKLINLAEGGRGNREITQGTINYATLKPDIAKDSLFVIQLSECMRSLIYWYDSFDGRNLKYHMTPGIFYDPEVKKGKKWLWWQGDDDHPNSNFHQWLWKGREILSPMFLNIKFSLEKTYWGIINFVNLCESNNYPYLIFEGLNDHIPYEENEKWYLHQSAEGAFGHKSSQEEKKYFKLHEPIDSELLTYIKSLKYYYHGDSVETNTLWNFIHMRPDENYYKGNSDHPNELGAKMWAKYLVEVL